MAFTGFVVCFKEDWPPDRGLDLRETCPRATWLALPSEIVKETRRGLLDNACIRLLVDGGSAGMTQTSHWGTFPMVNLAGSSSTSNYFEADGVNFYKRERF